MKIFLKVVFLLGIASNVFGTDRGAYAHHFSIESDYVFLKRAHSYNTHLVSAAEYLINPPGYSPPPECAKAPGKPLIGSKDLIRNMRFDKGFSVALKVFQDVKTTWEARYLGGLSWQGEKTLTCPDNLNLDGTIRYGTRDYRFANQVKAIYDSSMYSWQLNCWRHITPRHVDNFSVSWLAGFRMFDIDEKSKLYFQKDQRISRYRVNTENDFFGPQIGGALEYNPYSFLTWALVVKVGGMFNRDKQHTKMYDDNNTIKIHDTGQSGSHFSYMSEAYPNIELRPTKHFFFNFSYRIIYIGAVTTAEQNIVLSGSGTTLNHKNHIIYHGATGGIHFNF